jgi:hypothetical protein
MGIANMLSSKSNVKSNPSRHSGETIGPNTSSTAIAHDEDRGKILAAPEMREPKPSIATAAIVEDEESCR